MGAGDRFRFLQEPGPWLWAALLLGAGLRIYLIAFTEGTFDAAIWLHHGSSISENGLLKHYRLAEAFNHPPFMGIVVAGIHDLAQITGLPFPLLLRAPFALLDLGNAWLLLRMLRGSPARYVVFAGYWLSPLAIIFSAFHGNTDTAVAFFALLAVAAAASGQALLAGVALGVGLWVKVPVILAAPAIFFCLPSWPRRAVFAGTVLLVGVSTALPALLAEPALLYQRILVYPGSGVMLPTGVPIWGIGPVLGGEGRFEVFVASFADSAARWNTLVCILPIVLLAWLRRHETGARKLGTTVLGSFVILYGFSSSWAWQYLAWSLPFWFLADAKLAFLFHGLVGAYVYAAYAHLCGSFLLRGRWDFMGHPPWPDALLWLRNASVVLCFAMAWGFLVTAAARQWRAGAARETET